MPTEPQDMRIDDLAREAGVATTTVRLYQTKGLLPPPRMVGRTGYYDAAHLTRLQVIARLQDEGFSLAGIRTLLDNWERGADLGALVGAEAELGALLGNRHELVLRPDELVDRFPPGTLDPESIQRAAALGLVEARPDGSIRVRDARFVETGAALAELGIPTQEILDEWEALSRVTDAIAERFAALFESRFLPADWREGLGPDEVARLSETLGRLRASGERVVLASLDASIANLAAQRFAELLPSADDAVAG